MSLTNSKFSTTFTIIFLVGLLKSSLSSASQGIEDHSSANYLILQSDLSKQLRQSTILSILRSHSGFLWLATFNGALRHDGNKLVRYFDWIDNRGNKHPLNIIKLLETSDGEIIAVTFDSGLLYFDSVSKAFKAHPAFDKSPSKAQDPEISDALSDSSGLIWVGYQQGNVSRFNTKSRNIRHFNLNAKQRISDIVEDSLGKVHIVSESGTVYSFDAHRDTYKEWTLRSVCGLQDKPVEELHTIAGNFYLIGTRGSGLYQFDAKSNDCEFVQLKNGFSKNSRYATIHEIAYIETLNETRIATDQGLFVIQEDKSTKYFSKDNSELTNNEVITLFSDPGQLDWIGTYSGLNTINKPLFELFNPEDDHRLHSITAISSSKSFGTWIATYEDLLWFDHSSGKHVSVKDKYPDIDFNFQPIMALLVENESIWIGTRNRGAIRFSPSLQQLKRFSLTSKPNLSANSISGFLRLDSGELLIGTYGGGLNIIYNDQTIGRFINDSSATSIANNKVIFLYQDKSSRVWIGTEGGLQLFDPKTETFRRANFKNNAGLKSSIVWSASEDQAGRIWFGTLHDGLLVSEASNANNDAPLLRPYKNNDLVDRTVYAIQVSKSGEVWISTNSGLTRIKNGMDIRHFSKKNGLQNMEFELGASHKDSNEILYFGGISGYNKFNPKDITLESTPPPVVLTDISVAGKTPGLSKAIQDVDMLELDYLDYYVTFEFSVLDYLDPANNQYRYKLEGFDPRWINIGNRNTATYTNLPAGNYTLRVQGASSSGVWNRDGISASLRVNPAPWKSWWAYCIYTMLALFLAWHAKKTYDNAVIRKRALQLARDMQETADRAMDDVQEQLDQQTRLVDTIHHFNLQKLELVSECLRRHADFLPETVSESILHNQERRLAALLSLEKSLFYKHEELLADLHRFTDYLVSDLVSRTSNPAAAHINVINAVTDQLFPAQSALPISIVLYELVGNAVDHAFDPESQSCFIKVEVTPVENLTHASECVQISVADNGVGLPGIVSFDSPESEGLATVAETVAGLGGDIYVTVQQGTLVRVTLPIGRTDVDEKAL